MRLHITSLMIFNVLVSIGISAPAYLPKGTKICVNPALSDVFTKKKYNGNFENEVSLAKRLQELKSDLSNIRGRKKSLETSLESNQVEESEEDLPLSNYRRQQSIEMANENLGLGAPSPQELKANLTTTNASLTKMEAEEKQMMGLLRDALYKTYLSEIGGWNDLKLENVEVTGGPESSELRLHASVKDGAGGTTSIVLQPDGFVQIEKFPYSDHMDRHYDLVQGLLKEQVDNTNYSLDRYGDEPPFMYRITNRPQSKWLFKYENENGKGGKETLFEASEGQAEAQKTVFYCPKRKVEKEEVPLRVSIPRTTLNYGEALPKVSVPSTKLKHLEKPLTPSLLTHEDVYYRKMDSEQDKRKPTHGE